MEGVEEREILKQRKQCGIGVQGQKETGQFSTLRGQYGCPQRERRSWVQDEVQASRGVNSDTDMSATAVCSHFLCTEDTH